MPRRRSYGFSYSPRRALGISAAKGRIARATGIPTTRAGRQRKLGRMVSGGGCLLAAVLLLLVTLTVGTLIGCAAPAQDSAPTATPAATQPHGQGSGAARSTSTPTAAPTLRPTDTPTSAPTRTAASTAPPTKTLAPTATHTAQPTSAPTRAPTSEPTRELTAEPASEPTIEPAAEPTLEPTAAPSEAPATMFIEIVSYTNPAHKGSRVSLSAKTLPGAACEITVHLKSGPSQASGLEPRAADANGEVTWSWKVAANTSAGEWSISVSASKDGQSTAQEVPFVVQ